MTSAEYLARQIQLAEGKWKDRVTLKDSGGDSQLDAHIFGGYAQKGALRVCPAPQTWVASELHRESSIAKERRKARAERTLAKPPKGEKP